jgi:hypothetical protein
VLILSIIHRTRDPHLSPLYHHLCLTNPTKQLCHPVPSPLHHPSFSTAKPAKQTRASPPQSTFSSSVPRGFIHGSTSAIFPITTQHHHRIVPAISIFSLQFQISQSQLHFTTGPPARAHHHHYHESPIIKFNSTKPANLSVINFNSYSNQKKTHNNNKSQQPIINTAAARDAQITNTHTVLLITAPPPSPAVAAASITAAVALCCCRPQAAAASPNLP